LIIVSVGGLLHVVILIKCVLHAEGSVIADDETPFEISPVFGRIKLCKMNDWSILVCKNFTRDLRKWKLEVDRFWTGGFDGQLDNFTDVGIVLGSE
jgi:hypothetical protein